LYALGKILLCCKDGLIINRKERRIEVKQNEKKEPYVSVLMDLVPFSTDDVIRTSGLIGTGSETNEDNLPSDSWTPPEF
jgi:hypothetical protein